MKQEKVMLMQIALEIFKLEVQRGNQNAVFYAIYNQLKSELNDEPKVESKPTASEYFKTNPS